MAESSSPDIPVMDEKSLGRNSWKVIGAGGFGQVYKARHLQWKSDVAVKLLCFNDGSELEKSLLREVKLMRQGESPHVVKVLGVFKGRRPSVPFTEVGLVMELMETGCLASLQKKLNPTPLPWSLVFQLAHQVAVGMNHLHSLDPPIIHKDLKPENVLLDKDLNAKITDFGLSKFDNCSTSARIKGAGTTSYMPPEALLLDRSTPAFDVYSYGILLCSIMKGKKPYGQDVRSILEMQVCIGKRPSLDEVDPKQAMGLEDLVELMERCWHQEPDKRPLFTDCTAVTAALLEKHQPGIKDAVHQVVTELFPPSLLDQEESGEELIQGQQDQSDHAVEMKEIKSELERVQRLERESLQRESLQREMEERERLQRERLQRLEREMEEREGLQREMEERERLQREMEERERLQRERLQRLEREMEERERLQRERLQRLEREMEERERLQRERLQREMEERERLQREMEERERLQREMEERERLQGEMEEREREAQIKRAREVKGAADKLMCVRKEFRESVSEPVLDELLEELLEKRVITDKEMKSVRAAEGRLGKAWRVLLMVRGKGDEASSVTMDILRLLDPVLSKKLQQAAVQRKQTQGATAKLRSVRKEFRESVSESVLDELLDQLLEKRVITDKEMKSVRAEEGRADKAWRVLLMVGRTGDKASSGMMDILRQLDPVLSEKLWE